MKDKLAMRIYVVEPRGSGGMIHYAYQLCNALSEYVTDVKLVTAKVYELDDYPHGFHVIKLLSLWDRNNPVPDAIVRNRLSMIWGKGYRSVRRAFRGVRLFLGWIKLTTYLLRERPDIAQFGSIEFPFEALFLRYLKFRGLTLTQICHEFEPREKGLSLLVKMNNYLLKNVFGAFSIMFFHSRSNEARFNELYPDISGVQHNIIPMGNGQIFPPDKDSRKKKEALAAKYGIRPDDLVILFFGNITPSKGIPDLLEAFARVSAQNDRARLVVAGMPLKYINMKDLVDLASDFGIQARTIFDTRYIPLDEVGSLMELATIVVYPYISSTQSASIQAAYAFGKPVVVTRVGGLPDIVEDGKSGFLVSPNAPEELSAAILGIINDPALIKNMGLYAKELSETRFAWGPIAGKIAQVYQDFLYGGRDHLTALKQTTN